MRAYLTWQHCIYEIAFLADSHPCKGNVRYAWKDVLHLSEASDSCLPEFLDLEEITLTFRPPLPTYPLDYVYWNALIALLCIYRNAAATSCMNVQQACDEMLLLWLFNHSWVFEKTKQKRNATIARFWVFSWLTRYDSELVFLWASLHVVLLICGLWNVAAL